MQSSIGHMIDLVSLSLFSAYYSMIKKLPTTANRQITRIDDVYNKVKQSNQADIVSPNWSLPLAEDEIYIPACRGIFGSTPVYTTVESGDIVVTCGVSSINLSDELVATYPKLSFPRYRNYTSELGELYGHTFVHPDGIIVRLDANDPSNWTKGILVKLDNTLAVDSVVEIWTNPTTTATKKSLTSPFDNVLSIMSADTNLYCLQHDFNTMIYDGGYTYQKGWNWVYDGESYSMRNGYVIKDATNIYTGIDYTKPGYPSYFQIQFDGMYIYWNNTHATISGSNPYGGFLENADNFYVKRLEVA